MVSSDATMSLFKSNGIAPFFPRYTYGKQSWGERQVVQTTQSEVSADRIDLALGHPSPALLPLELLREASARRLRQKDRSFLQYGYEQGDLRFRTQLARFLSSGYGAEVSPEELFVSGGVSQALDLICSLFTQPGELVLVEEPSYFLALRIFADHGLRVEGLATDRHGLLPEALRERLRQTRPAMLYTVPTHHNPAGTTLPTTRREQVLELCQEHGVLLVADEVYHLLTFAGAPPPPLGSFARQGGVFSLGSFSKILAPGLRLGWIQGSPDLLRRLATCGFLDSGGGLAPFTSAVVGSLLERGAQEEHLRKLRGVYGSRARALGASLSKFLAVSDEPPAGGFFFWVRLPEIADTEALLPEARVVGVTFAPGSRFSTSGGQRERLRLSFSYYEERQLGEGVARLAEAVRRFRPPGRGS
jgi:DNA-binding transcriptional MocR family regulator